MGEQVDEVKKPRGKKSNEKVERTKPQKKDKRKSLKDPDHKHEISREPEGSETAGGRDDDGVTESEFVSVVRTKKKKKKKSQISHPEMLRIAGELAQLREQYGRMSN